MAIFFGGVINGVWITLHQLETRGRWGAVKAAVQLITILTACVWAGMYLGGRFAQTTPAPLGLYVAVPILLVVGWACGGSAMYWVMPSDVVADSA